MSIAQIALKGRISFFITRALLGLLFGGFIPDIILLLTYFYKNCELPLRLSYLWTALPLTNMAGSLLASGLLLLRGRAGLAGWQWLFLVEGIYTLLVGVMSWYMMPAGPCQTKGCFRGPWFTEREETIMVNRMLRDDPSKGDLNNRTGVSPRGLLRTLSEYDMWPLYLVSQPIPWFGRSLI